jgi:hypothetical protein
MFSTSVKIVSPEGTTPTDQVSQQGGMAHATNVWNGKCIENLDFS